MKLVVAATFGSLPEASIAFSSLTAAGFNPVAGFNMNTPGTADGMAPSAYRVLVPDDEVQASRQFLSELLHALANKADDPDDLSSLNEEQEDIPSQATLSSLRPVVRWLAGGALIIWLLVIGALLLRR